MQRPFVDGLKGEREVREQPVRGRFERGGGQRAAEVRLVKPDVPVAGGGRLGAQPAQGILVAGGDQDERVGVGVPVAEGVRVGDGEVECGMGRLRGLGPGRQVGAGDQIETRGANLEVRHGFDVNDASPSRPGLPLRGR